MIRRHLDIVGGSYVQVKAQSFLNPLLPLFLFTNLSFVHRSKVQDRELALTVALNGRDAETLTEGDLPHSSEARHEIARERSITNVPHLERSVRATDDFVIVVLEARNRTRVRRKRVPAFTRRWIPNSQSRIGRS